MMHGRLYFDQASSIRSQTEPDARVAGLQRIVGLAAARIFHLPEAVIVEAEHIDQLQAPAIFGTLQARDGVPGDVGIVIGLAAGLVREIRPVQRRDDPDQRIDVDEACVREILPDSLAGGDVGTGKREA